MNKEELWEDKIIITRDEVSGRPKVACEGMWSGKDRRMINRMMLKAMRLSSNEAKKVYKKACIEEEDNKVDSIKQKRISGRNKIVERLTYRVYSYQNIATINPLNQKIGI